MSLEVCDVHGEPWKVVPAGISKKTGKPYNEFRSCPVMGCKEQPPKPGETVWNNPNVPVEVINASKAASIGTTTDVSVWEAKDRLSARQTAWNAVSNIISAMENAGIHTSWPEIEAMVKSVYEDLLSAKNGE